MESEGAVTDQADLVVDPLGASVGDTVVLEGEDPGQLLLDRPREFATDSSRCRDQPARLIQ